VLLLYLSDTASQVNQDKKQNMGRQYNNVGATIVAMAGINFQKIKRIEDQP